jgi:hypothetical protein
MALYHDLPFSLSEPGPDNVYGVGNYHINVFSHGHSTVPFATLFFLDSHGQIHSDTKGPDYEPIQPSQIEWFTKTSQDLREERADPHPHTTLVFFHIPIPEVTEDDRIIKVGGERGEPTEGPSINTHFYDALAQECVAAVSFGHDHVNDFCASLKSEDDGAPYGPWLCYGVGSGFGGYGSHGGKRYHRRMRVWELNVADGSIKTWK